MKRVVSALIVLAVLMCGCSAQARRSHVRAGTARGHGPPGLTTGFFSDTVLTGPDAALRAQWIPRAATEGAGIVRLNITWLQVAPARRPSGFDPADPASPGYDWSAYDAVVRDLTDHGIRVLINLWGAPRWAERGRVRAAVRDGTWRPSPAQFGAFARAAARRYSGRFPDPANPGHALPRVALWQAWNEPNLDYYLSPQWVLRGRRYIRQAPAIYRSLLNAFYAGVRSVARSNFVVTAGTAPYGDDLGTDPPGQERTPPIAFDRALFCLTDRLTVSRGCADPPHLDAISNHPYGVGGPLWHALNRDDAAVADMYKVARVLRAAERAHHVLPREHHRLWVTEISWDSRPPDPRGVPIQRHARWVEQAMWELWRQGVDTVLWYSLRDAPPIPNYASSYQAGMYYLRGAPKPAAVGYRFPFLTSRTGAGRVQAWGRAPSAGTLVIEARHRHAWRVVAQLRVRRHAVFLTSLNSSAPATFRAQVGGDTSLTWTQR